MDQLRGQAGALNLGYQERVGQGGELARPGRASRRRLDRWVEDDLEYIDRWSLWLDLKIMLRTIPAALEGR